MAEKQYNTYEKSSVFQESIGTSLDFKNVWRENTLHDIAYIQGSLLDYVKFYGQNPPATESTYPLFSKTGKYMGSITFKVGTDPELNIIDGFSESDWNSQPIPYFISKSAVTKGISS